MKIAEALVRIKSLRKEYNDTNIVLFTEGSEVIVPERLADGLRQKQLLLQEIARLKSLIARTNVQTGISFNGATLTLSHALNLLDALKEEKQFLDTNVIRSLRGVTPSRNVRVGLEWTDVKLAPNFDETDAFEILNRSRKLEADVATLSSLITATNWSTDLITT